MSSIECQKKRHDHYIAKNIFVGYRVRTEVPWKSIPFPSTSHHRKAFTIDKKLADIRTAFINALSLAVKGGLTSMSTAVLKGGWRFPLDLAIKTMSTHHPSSQGKVGR